MHGAANQGMLGECLGAAWGGAAAAVLAGCKVQGVYFEAFACLVFYWQIPWIPPRECPPLALVLPCAHVTRNMNFSSTVQSIASTMALVIVSGNV